MSEIDTSGLNPDSREEWPALIAGDGTQRPIELLRPNSEAHKVVLEYLIDRLRMSERNMTKFYARWRVSERKTQAYIDLPDYEKILKESTDAGQPAKAVSITVPHTYATIMTIVTYLVHTFGGRKPIFQVGSHKKEEVHAARMMETMLQFNCDHVRLLKSMFQFFTDGELYGLGILRTQWKREIKKRSVWKVQQQMMMGIPTGVQRTRIREDHVTFEGTEVAPVDPFMFFPDPRVPMADVAKKGEFVFWRTYEGKHELLRAEANGEIKWVKYAGQMRPLHGAESDNVSNRNLISQGESVPGMAWEGDRKLSNFYQVDQGSVVIIPRELGLGESERPEKWIFTILNRNQIVQAEPMDNDHDMHPVIVSEPYTLGYGFGNFGATDMLGPLQDIVSWFVNSHMHNVRSAMNNMFVVDPSMVEMQDLKYPGPGKIIRLKRAAYGQDVRQVLQQLAVADVTGSHIKDMELIMRIADSLSMVNDNIRGVQDFGGRKTATEVRTAGEAAASRLAAHARLISAQSLSDLAAQMCLNYQQYLEETFYLQVVGTEGMSDPVHISPEAVTGDFSFPTHDGTLPLDRVAMLDVWKEIFMAMLQDQQLRMTYNIPKVFEFIAKLGGALNVDEFRMMPQEQIDQQLQAGNMMPVDQALGPQPGPSQTPGVQPQPQQRMQGRV